MDQANDFPLPANLPCPADDGAADHLEGTPIPKITLRSSFGGIVELASLRAPRVVVYCYPMTGVPGKPLPGSWNNIPGARGCTPQARNFQEHYGEFLDLAIDVYGLSTQSSDYQREMAKRLNLPFEILSDSEFKFCDALRLPTFEVYGMMLLKRLTLVIRVTRIEHVFYPVFPPDQSADQVLKWLNDHPL